jgi:hypothetical protein
MRHPQSVRALGFVLLLALLLPVGFTTASAPGRLPVWMAQEDEAAAAGPQAALQEFGGGAGTEADPYLVATAAHLNNVRNHLSAHFLQTADINLGTSPWNSGEGWVPIGSLASSFTGVYDGGGFRIQNLTISRPNGSYQGLFGSAMQAVLRNVHLDDMNLQTVGTTGGLAGALSGGAVDASSVTGRIVSDGGPVGGLVGTVGLNVLIHHVSVDAEVRGQAFVGGIAGTSGGQIRHSSASGSVHAGQVYAGGIVGANMPEGWVLDSYSRSSVEGQNFVGGFIGDGGNVFRSYSTGAVTGSGSNVGGFAGSGANHAGTFVSCYWDTQTSGRTTSSACEGRTTAQMRQRATYELFNFHTLWTIEEGSAYPLFRDLGSYPGPQPVSLSDLAGSGTTLDPYIITTADELYAIRQDVTAAYWLANDIDLSATVVWDYGRGWEPIGTSGNRFTGSFDGGGYTLRNLSLSRPNNFNQGLFGWVSNAELGNVHLQSVNMAVGSTSGGLAANPFGTDIEDVSLAGQIVSVGFSVGGLVGNIGGGDLIRVHTLVDVRGGNTVGGLAGRAGGDIQQAYSRGSVRGANDVGGLVGFYDTTAGSISDSYSRAAVDGAARVGGLVGTVQRGEIARAYSTGQVTGTGPNLGGLVGSSEGTVGDSYWDTQTSGRTASAGGADRTTAQMTSPHAANTYVGWDFAGTWLEDTDHSANDGYPYLPTLARATVEVEILGPNQMFPGEAVDYVVSFANYSPEVVANAVLTVRLPFLAAYAESSSGGIYWPGRHQVFWPLGDLVPGGRGRLLVTVVYEWGIPDGTVDGLAALLIGGGLNDEALDPESYLSYGATEVTAAVSLDEAQWQAAAAADADLLALYNQSLAGGYVWAGAYRLTFGDGSTSAQAIMIHRPTRAARFVYLDDGHAVASTFAGSLFTVQDTTGGMTWDLNTEEPEYWGEWDLAGGASIPGTTRALLAPLSGGAGCCLNNCLSNVAMTAVVGRVGRLVEAALTAMDCQVGVETGSGTDLAKCAAGLQDKVPFLGDAIGVAECLRDCNADPNSHDCTEDLITCEPGRFDLYHWFGVPRYHRYRCIDGCYSTRRESITCALNDCCVPGVGCRPSASASTLSADAEGGGGAACKDGECNAPSDPNEKYGPEGDLLPGEWVSYLIEYENVGTGPAADVFILDYLDEAFDAATLQVGANASYSPAARLISWDIGLLDPAGQLGATGEVSLEARLRSDLPGGTIITNQATVYFPTVPEETPTGVVINVIQPVVAEPQRLTTQMNTPVSVRLRGREVSNAPLTYRLVQNPSYGTLSGTAPNLTYTPMEGRSGMDRFAFVVNNGVMDSRPAYVYIRTSGAVYLPMVLRQ